jgi:hypothetical protein
MSTAEKTLQDKVKEWLVSEGYPLEFRTALEFLKQPFTVRQGSYVQCSGEGLREVDVIAYATAEEHIRIYHVIECKWSGNKPWIILTSETHQIAESACVNQTISSLLGGSITWTLAGDPEVASIGLFASPKRAGFNGRQAFSKGSDPFYAAIQSVVSKAKSIVDTYDERCDLSKALPEWGAVAFPMIVVEGGLFEAHMDSSSGDIVVQPTKHVRVHWRGSEAWSYHASVDIVSDDYICEIARARAHDTNLLLKKMRLARQNIEACWEKNSLRQLEFQRAPRGTTGLPSILRAILVRERETQSKRLQLGASPEENKITGRREGTKKRGRNG